MASCSPSLTAAMLHQLDDYIAACCTFGWLANAFMRDELR